MSVSKPKERKLCYILREERFFIQGLETAQGWHCSNFVINGVPQTRTIETKSRARIQSASEWDVQIVTYKCVSWTKEKKEKNLPGRRLWVNLYIKIPVWNLFRSWMVRVCSLANRGAEWSRWCEEVQIRIALFWVMYKECSLLLDVCDQTMLL